MQVCQYEHQLFDHFFPGEDPEGPSLGPLMDPLATILYDALRPRFIHLHELEELCEIVDILAHEVSCLTGLELEHELVQILTCPREVLDACEVKAKNIPVCKSLTWTLITHSCHP